MARSTPDYDFFPPDRSGGGSGTAGTGRPERRPKGLSTLSAEQDDAPYLPGGRLSAPPTSPPPVFQRPAEPRPDVRPWSVPQQGGGAGDRMQADDEPWFRRPAVPAARDTGSRTATTPAPAAAPQPTAPPSTPAPATPTSGRPVPAFTAHAGSQRPAPTGWTPPAPRPPSDLALGRPAAPRSRRAAVAAVLALALAGAATAAAAVVVPRYVERADRTVWERTTVRIPRTVAGLPRITTASATAQARSSQVHLLGSGAGQMISDLAVYGHDRGTRVAVVVARPQHPLRADERDLVRSSFTQAVAAEGIVLTERDPGPLGGWFGCGVKAGRTTTCLAVDAGAVVSVTVTATGASAVTVAREARATVEQRG